jgi:hypothetical protein
MNLQPESPVADNLKVYYQKYSLSLVAQKVRQRGILKLTDSAMDSQTVINSLMAITKVRPMEKPMVINLGF